ncbi:MAG: hypothetical protein JWP27_2015 [Flaviaesturariibacter sp.]|nr:hypothetical protein [Flaviaesturariibacter sp.]
MFTKINLAKLRNAELIEYLTQLLGTVDTGFGATAMPALVGQCRGRLASALTGLRELHRLDPGSKLTAELDDLDERRDSLMAGLGMLCQAFARHPDEALQSAAKLLQRNLSLYGSGVTVSSQTRPAETATIDSILADWSDKRDLNAAAAALPASPYLRALKTVNDSYREKSVERDAQDGSALPTNMVAKRGEAGTAYTDLLTMLNSHYHVSEGTQPWGNIAAGMNAVTERFADMVAARNGRSKAAKARVGGL